MARKPVIRPDPRGAGNGFSGEAGIGVGTADARSSEGTVNMTIYKAKNFIDSYRIRAKSREINELTGRTWRSDLTRYVIENIVSRIQFEPESVVVDIGCGDALFLQMAAAKGVDSFKGRLIGILPTEEEVCRVREHLVRSNYNRNNLISIEIGRLDQLNLPDGYADIVVTNGVLLLLQSLECVVNALREIRRISKPNAFIFIGELPDKDEMAGKNYGDSITSWLIWVLKNQGFGQFVIRLKQLLVSLFSREPFIINPKKSFLRSQKISFCLPKTITSELKLITGTKKWTWREIFSIARPVGTISPNLLPNNYRSPPDRDPPQRG